MRQQTMKYLGYVILAIGAVITLTGAWLYRSVRDTWGYNSVNNTKFKALSSLTGVKQKVSSFVLAPSLQSAQVPFRSAVLLIAGVVIVAATAVWMSVKRLWGA